MRIEETLATSATPAEIWELIRDPAAIGGLGERISVTPLEAAGQPGAGSRYRVLLDFGAAPVGSNVEIVEYTPGRELAWTSLTGVDHRFRLRIREAADGSATMLTLRFGYTSPGLLGSVADLAAFRSVRSILREAIASLVSRAEAGAPAA